MKTDKILQAILADGHRALFEFANRFENNFEQLSKGEREMCLGAVRSYQPKSAEEAGIIAAAEYTMIRVCNADRIANSVQIIDQ